MTMLRTAETATTEQLAVPRGIKTGDFEKRVIPVHNGEWRKESETIWRFYRDSEWKL